jgi:hypothetical protein
MQVRREIDPRIDVPSVVTPVPPGVDPLTFARELAEDDARATDGADEWELTEWSGGLMELRMRRAGASWQTDLYRVEVLPPEAETRTP